MLTGRVGSRALLFDPSVRVGPTGGVNYIGHDIFDCFLGPNCGAWVLARTRADLCVE